MRVLYVPISDKLWLAHLQSGHGLGAYAGERFQRGYGLGAIFGPLLRTILPMAKTVGKAVGKQALRTGATIASDVLAGEDVKESLKARSRQGADRLLNKGIKAMKKKKTSGRKKKKQQKGRGLGIRPKKAASKTIKRVAVRRKTIKRKRDALGLY